MEFMVEVVKAAAIVTEAVAVFAMEFMVEVVEVLI